MTPASMLALFAAMAALAAVPSVSVLAVTARAASAGFLHGALTAAGVVAGDVLFILLAIFGLALLAETMGSQFGLLQWLGAAYLLWLGTQLWRAGDPASAPAGAPRSSLLSSFMTGLLITLGDQKAVLFYLGFLPAFIDLSTVSASDTILISGIAVVAVGGVKLVYAALASGAGNRLGHDVAPLLNRLGALVVIAAGLWLLAKAAGLPR
jgi:threonine/homoserine/homoserine lactone efflux protein